MPKTEAAQRRQLRRKRWGENLKAALTERQMSPRDLHRQLLLEDEADISAQTIYFWLNGTTSPSAEHQAAVSKVLGTPAHELFPVDMGKAS